MPSVLDYYNMMKDDDIKIIFNVSFNADDIRTYADILKKHIPKDELPPNVPRYIFTVFIEQITNVLQYSERENRYSGKYGKVMSAPIGLFIIGENDTSYFSQTGNIIKNEYIEQVKARIDHINTLNKQELREYYKEQRRSDNKNPVSKGAGLGLIEIAKRASAPIKYRFMPVEEDLSFFTMLVEIHKET